LSERKPERIFQGNGVSSGIVLGQALKLDSHNRVILKIRIEDDRLVEEEVQRVMRAIQASKEQLEALKTRLEEKVGREHSFVLDVHLLMLEDKSLLAEIFANIRNHRANAEWAVRQATERILDAYESLEDEYFRDRRSDIEDVLERILFNLSGRRPFSWKQLPQDLIIVSQDFNPSSFAVIDLQKVRGLALESGGRTSHTAIIAHSLEIPAVVGLDSATLEIESGEEVIINGLSGRVIVNPDEAMRRSYQVRKEEFETFKWEVTQGSALPAVTNDDHPIRVLANIELPEEVSLAQKYGADGVGLYRTEFLYLRHRQLPTEEELFQHYRQVVEAMAPREVTIRTLDIGGDKFLSDLEYAPEMNPALGLRAIRY
jgi:phosphotransferase system enzyme I (PtsI)